MTTETPEVSKSQRQRATYVAFVNDVERLCRRDPGARAALRAGLRRDLDHPRTRPMHRLLIPLLPGGCGDRTTQAYYTVASLIAAQPRYAFAPDQDDDEESEEEQAAEGESGDDAASSKPPYWPSFGAALGQAVAAKDTSMRLSAAESRINLLTRQSIRGIHLHLPAAVNQVRTTDTDVDWAQLLADLVDWPYRSGRISRRWLQDFYRITAGIDQD